MGRAAPGKQSREASAPYQQTFAAGAAPGDITSFVVTAAAAGTPAVKPYQNACSGMIVVPTVSTGFVIAWKDCNGKVNTLTVPTGNAIGNYIDLPFAATSIDTLTGCSVVVYWHAGTGLNQG